MSVPLSKLSAASNNMTIEQTDLCDGKSGACGCAQMLEEAITRGNPQEIYRQS